MAVTLDAAALAEALRRDLPLAERLLPTCAALVQRYAPAAPEAVQNEAAIRCAGYLAEQPKAAIRSSRLDDLEVEYNASSISALRHSGAMGLLTLWKVRRGGAA